MKPASLAITALAFLLTLHLTHAQSGPESLDLTFNYSQSNFTLYQINYVEGIDNNFNNSPFHFTLIALDTNNSVAQNFTSDDLRFNYLENDSSATGQFYWANTSNGTLDFFLPLTPYLSQLEIFDENNTPVANLSIQNYVQAYCQQDPNVCPNATEVAVMDQNDSEYQPTIETTTSTTQYNYSAPTTQTTAQANYPTTTMQNNYPSSTTADATEHAQGIAVYLLYALVAICILAIIAMLKFKPKKRWDI